MPISIQRFPFTIGPENFGFVCFYEFPDFGLKFSLVVNRGVEVVALVVKVQRVEPLEEGVIDSEAKVCRTSDRFSEFSYWKQGNIFCVILFYNIPSKSLPDPTSTEFHE